MFSLELPWVFALLPLPLLWHWLLPAAEQQDAPLRVPFIEQWRAATSSSANSRQRSLLAILFLSLIWCLLLLAAARPLWRGEPVSQQTTGRDLLLAVDISGSMQFPDMIIDDQPVDRLTAVKRVVGEFAGRRTGDRLGLILFGSNAYFHVPLTFDGKTLQTLLGESEIGFAGQNTAIGDAIAMAVKQLRDQAVNSRVLVLMTDGSNTAGTVTPEEATRWAQQIGLKIYTVGVGAYEAVQPGLLGDRTINPSADLNEDALTSIANATGGRYFRASNSAELAEIYQLLDQLEPAEHEFAVFRPRISLAHWPLGIALTLSIMLALLSIWRHLRGEN